MDGDGKVYVVLVFVFFFAVVGFVLFFFILTRSQPIGGKCTGNNECDPGLVCSSGFCRVPVGGACTTITDCESGAKECRSLSPGQETTCNPSGTGSLGDPCGNAIGNMACASSFVCDNLPPTSSTAKQPTFTCVIPDGDYGCQNSNSCTSNANCVNGQCVVPPPPAPLAIGNPIATFTSIGSNIARAQIGVNVERESRYQRLPINDRLIYDGKYLDAGNAGLMVNGKLVNDTVYSQLVSYDGYIYGLREGKLYRIDYATFRAYPQSLPLSNLTFISATLDDNGLWVQNATQGHFYVSTNAWTPVEKVRLDRGRWRIYGGNANLYQEQENLEDPYSNNVAVDWDGNLIYPEGNVRVKVFGKEVSYY